MHILYISNSAFLLVTADSSSRIASRSEFFAQPKDKDLSDVPSHYTGNGFIRLGCNNRRYHQVAATNVQGIEKTGGRMREAPLIYEIVNDDTNLIELFVPVFLHVVYHFILCVYDLL